jgi:hypothetical protein
MSFPAADRVLHNTNEDDKNAGLPSLLQTLEGDSVDLYIEKHRKSNQPPNALFLSFLLPLASCYIPHERITELSLRSSGMLG